MRPAIMGLLWILWAPLPAAADEVAAARAHFAAGHYGAAIDAAGSVVTRDPGSATARRLLGDALAATGRVDEALDAYRGPDGDKALPLDTAMAMARLEWIYRDPAAGRERARQVLDRAQDDGLAPAELIAAGDAARLLADGDPALYGEALRLYEQAIADSPDDPAAHTAIADLLLDRYNNTEALDAYRSALERDPGYVPALRGMARSRHFDHSAGALDAARRALEARPTDVESLALLGRLHIELEDYDQARGLLDRALAVNPRHPEALTLSAALAFLGGERDVFEERVARVRRAAPGYTEVYAVLAEVAARNRYYEEAARLARRGLSIDDQAWRTLALFGVNRLRLGDMDLGRRALEAAFRGDPYDPRTKNALELLDRMVEFERRASRRFVLVADPGEARVLAPLLLPIAEQAYDRFTEAYGYRPPTPVRIEVYRRHEDFSVRTTGLVGVDIMGVSFGPVVALDSPSAGNTGPVNIGSVLWHEIAHTFHLGLTGSRVPRWFSEGLAVYEERRARPGWGFDPTPGFLTAFLEGRLAKASALNEAFLRPRYPEQIVHAYYQASLVMEMVVRDHGFQAIVRLLEGYRDGLSTADMFEMVLDTDAASFDAALDDFVRERFGPALAAMAAAGGQAAGPRYPRLLAEGRQAMADGDLARAFEALTEAQGLFPEHAGAGSSYRLLADLHEQRGETGEAIDQLERAIAIDANDLDAHQRLVRLYRDAGDPTAAARVMAETLLIQPFDPALYREIAGIHEAQGEWSAAAEARAAVVALDPADPAGARYRLARAHQRAGNDGAALDQVIDALEIAPLYGDALELLLALSDATLRAGGRPHGLEPGTTNPDEDLEP